MKIILFQESNILNFAPLVSPNGLLKLTRLARINSRAVCAAISHTVPSLLFDGTHTPLGTSWCHVTLALMSRGIIHNSQTLSFKEQSGF
jgi:hypothetical protein